MQSLSTILSRIESQVNAYPHLGYGDQLQSLKQELHYMLQFMSQGFEDEQRTALYGDMLRRAMELEADVNHAVMVYKTPFFTGLTHTLKQTDTSTPALIEMLKRHCADDEDSLKCHIDDLQKAFTAVLLSASWKEYDSRLWLSYLISDETPTDDACTMVSAIMMSAYTCFSVEKFKTLAYVYMTTDKEVLRLRALVGWVVCCEWSERTAEVTAQLVEDENTVEDVIALLMQMVICELSEKESQQIESELMPKISKGRGVTICNGKIEMDVDDDDLVSGKSEKEIEEMEESMRKVLNKHKQGFDLYFKGFSHMKRFPFFYRLVNWFVPYSSTHPDVQPAMQKLGEMKFVHRIINEGSFCDSDKYSFVFALTHIVDQLPEKIREMLDKGELSPIGAMLTDDIKRKSSTYQLRFYMQDLFRFFRLFPSYKFPTIFGERIVHTEQILRLFAETHATKLTEYASFLARRGENDRARKVLSFIKTPMFEAELLGAAITLRTGDYRAAFLFYRMLAKQHTDHVKVLSGYARAAMQTSHYAEAAAAYDHLHSIDADNLSYTLNYILAEANGGRGAEVLNEIYRLDFEHEDNVHVKRVLGWVLLTVGKVQQADKVLSDITETSSDCLNASYAKWLLCDYASMAALMKEYIEKECPSSFTEEQRYEYLADAIHQDATVLQCPQMSDTNIKIVIDLLRFS